MVTSDKLDPAAAAWGFTEADMAALPVEVWPDNMDAVKVFSAMGTQWRTGMSGVTGLDYAVLPSVLRLTAVPRADWPAVFDDLRVMEGAALTHLHRDT